MSEDNENKQEEVKGKWTDRFKSIKAKNNASSTGDNENKNNDDNGDKAEDARGDDGEIQRLKEENESLKSKLLRTLAEIENTIRIGEEEKSKTLKFAITNITKELINIMENFYLSFENLEKNKNDFDSFLKGVELNFNEFKKVFDKNNIKRIYPLNEAFNPDFHEAISQIESDKDSGTVVEVLQAGYMLNERVIKPAMVIVAK